MIQPEQIGNARLYLGDCLAIMADLPDASVDMVLCDLPYGLTSNKWDSVIPLDLLWMHYKRLMTPGGVVVLMAAQPFTSALVMSNPAWFRHEWVWIKDRGSNFANTVRAPMREHESVLIFARCGGWTYNRQMQQRAPSGASRALYDFSANAHSDNYRTFGRKGRRRVGPLRVPSSWQVFKRETGLHPTQKPVALFAYLIRTYTNLGEVVLDNCIGSGTTAVACLQEGRRCIGIEQEQDYLTIARARIEAATQAQQEVV